jgi:Mg-chelatase subunit ChlD
VRRLIRWGERAGMGFLRTPTRVQGWLGGAGRTRQPGKGQQGITVDINFDPLIRAAEHGTDVVRGVIVHELGHHKYDFRVPGFRAAAGVVRANRAFRVFNVLLDERLERQLRRDRPEWAIHVDRMNAWLMQGQPIELPLAVYGQAVGQPPERIAERVDAGELPGRRQGDVVRMGPWDALGVPGLVPSLHAFLLGVFVVRDPEQVADPAARQALQMLPKDLAATRHGPLAALAVQITNLLGCHDGGDEQDQRWRELVVAHGGLLGELAGALDRNADVHTLANWASGDRTGADGGWEPGPPIAEADVTIERHRGRPKSRGTGRLGSTLNINVGQELGFYALEQRDHEPASVAATQRLRREVRPHVRRLRGHFERLGTSLVETPASRRGRRLDLAQIRDFAATRRPNVLIHAEERVQPDAYVGLLIDRSGSMSVGERMPLARRFGMLLAESAAGLPGIEGHVSAFDHTHFIRLGDFRRHSIAGLQPGGGNNDAGGLQAAANLALNSRKANRLLIMISDGLPTECSVDALRALVRKLRRDHDVRCAQVAVAPITEVCFPEFLDVSNVGSAEAIRRFGRLLTRLTRGWS